MEISNDKKKFIIFKLFKFKYNNMEEEINDNENEDINHSKIDFEDTNDLYMHDEKLDLSKNKNDIWSKINNIKNDDNNNAENNLKNIFLQFNTNFSA